MNEKDKTDGNGGLASKTKEQMKKNGDEGKEEEMRRKEEKEMRKRGK